MTARLIYPPSNWNQTVNAIDTLAVEWSSTFPGVNMELWCVKVKGTGAWFYWSLPGPLPANSPSDGPFYIHLGYYKLDDYINMFPTSCAFRILNSKNTTQKADFGQIPINTFRGKPETTYARTSTATSLGALPTGSTIPPPTSKPSMSTEGSTAPTATSTGTGNGSSDPLTLNTGARIGIGVGIGLGGTLLVMFAILVFKIHRKCSRGRGLRRNGSGKATLAAEQRFEKVEFMGRPVVQSPYFELQGSSGLPSPNRSFITDESTDVGRHSLGSRPSGLLTPTYGTGTRVQERHPGERFELGP